MSTQEYQAYLLEESIKDAALNEISESITGIPYDLLEEVLDQCALQQAHDSINKAYALSLSKNQ